MQSPHLPGGVRPAAALLAILIAFLLVAPAPWAAGQEAPAQDASPAGSGDAEAPEETPARIVPSEIVPRAEALAGRLRQLQTTLQPSDEIAVIGEELPALVQQLEDRRGGLSTLQDPSLTLRQLDDLRVQWERFDRQLQAWRKTLDDRSMELNTLVAGISRAEETWKLSAVPPEGQDALPDVLAERVRATLEDIAGVEKIVDERLASVLTVQDRVAELQGEVTDSLVAIGTSRRQVRAHLFKANQGPLWTHLLEPQAHTPLRVQIAETWEQDRTTLLSFFQENRQQTLLQLAIFIGLLILVVVLHGKVRRWALESESLHAAAYILSRPASVAVLISLYLRPLLYPGAPPTVIEIVRLIALVPVARLLPGLVPRALRSPLYGLLGLVAMQQVMNLVLEDSLLQRWLLLLITALSLLWIFWTLRKGGPASQVEGGRWWGATLKLARGASFLLAASFVANLIGLVNLAELLTGATLNAAWTAVAIFATVLVLRGLLEVLIRTRRASMLKIFDRHREDWIAKGNHILNLAATALWIWTALVALKIWFPLVRLGDRFLGAELALGSLRVSTGDILAFGFAIWLAIQVSRFVQMVLDEDVLPRMDLPRGVPATISRLVHYTMLGVGFLIALAAAGIEMTKFAVIFGALGVGIGFGLQTLVNNFVSGLILMFERPVQVGDTIEVGPLLGRVRRIGIRASVIRTFDGAEVIIPNGNLLADQVVNWTHSDFLRRIEIPVGVAYGTDVHRVIELMTQTIPVHEGILKEPPPEALFHGFGDSSLDFSVRGWTGDFESWIQVKSALTVAIHDALYRENIEIPFPQRDLHLRSVDEGVQRAIAPGGAPAKE